MSQRAVGSLRPLAQNSKSRGGLSPLSSGVQNCALSEFPAPTPNAEPTHNPLTPQPQAPISPLSQNSMDLAVHPGLYHRPGVLKLRKAPKGHSHQLGKLQKAKQPPLKGTPNTSVFRGKHAFSFNSASTWRSKVHVCPQFCYRLLFRFSHMREFAHDDPTTLASSLPPRTRSSLRLWRP